MQAPVSLVPEGPADAICKMESNVNKKQRSHFCVNDSDR